MEKSHHLAMGQKLGGHYEIVKVLGEDDFEILYLVKDLHMGDKKLVLKELFLSAYASRNEDASVQIMAKSKQAFEQTKKDVVVEIESIRSSQAQTSPEVYGYFEENNTLYTIMEFINSSDLSAYLQVNSQSETAEPEVVLALKKVKQEQVHEEKEEKPKSKIFLKLLIIGAILLIGLLYYSYDMIQKDKERTKNKSVQVVVKNEPIKHPPLEDKTKEKEEENLSSIPEVKEERVKPEGASYIEEGDIPAVPVVPVEEVVEVPQTEIYIDTDVVNDLEEQTYTQEEQVVIEQPVIYEPNIIEAPQPSTGKPSISLGTRIN